MRPFKTAFDLEFLEPYHRGHMAYTYKGVPCLKNPIDLALYMKLIWELKPRAIVEVGAFHGGASLFYADLCGTYGLNTWVISVDLRPIHLDHRISFIQADALSLDRSELPSMLDELPHPWLAIEDSAHTFEVCHSVMNFFAPRMCRGDVLIIEDGVTEDQGNAAYYRGGPNLAVSRFFEENPDTFRVMEEYCDFFGRNATFNPNGYLERL